MTKEKQFQLPESVVFSMIQFLNTQPACQLRDLINQNIKEVKDCSRTECKHNPVNQK